MKVLLTKPFFEQDLNYIQSRLQAGIEIIQPSQFNEAEIIQLAGDADVLFGGLITENILNVAKNLKLIQIPWTGVDNLNYELLNKFNLQIANSHSNSGIVAEHAIALMFDAAKKISSHDRMMRKGEWNRPQKDNSNKISPFSFKVQNAKIAFIGFGAIGHTIAQFLKGFDCEMMAFNRTGQGNPVQNLTYFPVETLNQKIAEADIIFVTVALTDTTRGMLNNAFFDSINPESILVNISRGEVIDEEALFHFLKNQPGFTAAIDTWYKYPNAANPQVLPSEKFAFHELENLIMSPHRAGMVKGELPHLDDAIENLNRLFTHQPLINLISLEQRY